MSKERRNAYRVPDSRLITEIADNRPAAAAVVNISYTGVYTIKPVNAGPIRGPEIVQVEIPVPEAGESIWAKGQVVFETQGRNAFGTGIRFLAMADRHHRLLDDLIETRREKMAKDVEQQMLWRQQLCDHPAPMAAPPPPTQTDNTVKMYMFPK
jgi:hypothetical protein